MPACSEPAGTRQTGLLQWGSGTPRTHPQEAEQAAVRARREAARKQVGLERRRGLKGVRVVRRGAEADAARPPAQDRHSCVLWLFKWCEKWPVTPHCTAHP